MADSHVWFSNGAQASGFTLPNGSMSENAAAVAAAHAAVAKAPLRLTIPTVANTPKMAETTAAQAVAAAAGITAVRVEAAATSDEDDDDKDYLTSADV